MPRPALATLVLLFGLLGCSEEAGGPAPVPELGGPTPSTTAPSVTMSDLERQISRRLGRQVEVTYALTLQGLECPDWHHEVPATLTCRGWFDSVPGTVEVSLRRGKDGAVAFDASLTGGVVATAKLVADLAQRGYDHVDCGAMPAYPTEVGSAITCAAMKDETPHHVVVTITSEDGSVTIQEF